MENGSPSTRATTSRVPSGAKARTSPALQSHIQNRPSCQRGDSPIRMPVAKVSVTRRHPGAGIEHQAAEVADQPVQLLDDARDPALHGLIRSIAGGGLELQGEAEE